MQDPARLPEASQHLLAIDSHLVLEMHSLEQDRGGVDFGQRERLCVLLFLTGETITVSRALPNRPAQAREAGLGSVDHHLAEVDNVDHHPEAVAGKPLELGGNSLGLVAFDKRLEVREVTPANELQQVSHELHHPRDRICHAAHDKPFCHGGESQPHHAEGRTICHSRKSPNHWALYAVANRKLVMKRTYTNIIHL